MPFLDRRLTTKLKAVDELVFQSLRKSEPSLISIFEYSYAGGKKLRPILIILTAHLFQKSSSQFLKLSAAVELLHTATLVHDDVIDNALFRRGQIALHNVRSVDCAVLTGDYLFAQSVDLISQLGKPEIVSILSSVLRTMAAGELKRGLTQTPVSSKEEYYRYIGAKTASLCSGATEMAAMLAESTPHQTRVLKEFGWEIGLAFQIVDDVLDLVGQLNETGKTVGRDLYTGVYTLPIILYHETHKDENIIAPLLVEDPNKTSIISLLRSIQESGAIRAAMDQAGEHIKQAQRILSCFPPTKARKQLFEFANYILTRKK